MNRPGLTYDSFRGAIDVDKPDRFDFSYWEPIAASLANQCRYKGSIPEGHFYSVAEHSLHVRDKVTKWPPFGRALKAEIALAALLHDAHEAVIGDIPAPLYRVLSPSAQREIDSIKRRIDGALGSAFGIELRDSPALEAVKRADAEVTADELWFFYGHTDPGREPDRTWCPDVLERAQAYDQYLEALQKAKARYDETR